MWQFWLILAGIFFIIEMITVGFFVFWLGVAALITMVASFFTSNIIILTTIFVVCSTILIFATKPFVNKFVNKETTKTNVYSIVGKTGIVIEEINSINSTGQIKVDGEVWSATGYQGCNIPLDTKVKIIEISGVKAVVSPITVSSNSN